MPTPRVRIASGTLTGSRLSSAADSAGNPAWLAVELMIRHTGGCWAQGGEPGILRSVKGANSLRRDRPTGSSTDLEYGDHTNLMTRSNNPKSLSIGKSLNSEQKSNVDNSRVPTARPTRKVKTLISLANVVLIIKIRNSSPSTGFWVSKSYLMQTKHLWEDDVEKNRKR
ncbi:uncharacterized protein LOC143224195 isoform X1 [Tachypleus tridentatus]|uniref:uncharacterized protein LOC143224195 isoform X1 n=1 Tax=Tachypleus tridentatus TaxID=6853 RepID=UPI003FD0DE67